jgi:hypothetical protein
MLSTDRKNRVLRARDLNLKNLIRTESRRCPDASQYKSEARGKGLVLATAIAARPYDGAADTRPYSSFRDIDGFRPTLTLVAFKLSPLTHCPNP